MSRPRLRLEAGFGADFVVFGQFWGSQWEPFWHRLLSKTGSEKRCAKINAFREFGVVLRRCYCGLRRGYGGVRWRHCGVQPGGGESLRSSLADYGSGLTRHSQSRTGAADLKALRAKPPPCFLVPFGVCFCYIFWCVFLILGAF